MEQETDYIVYEGVVVPKSALLKRGRPNKYGSIPDLDDDELADPDELQRMVIQQELEPLLMLPTKPAKPWMMPMRRSDRPRWRPWARRLN